MDFLDQIWVKINRNEFSPKFWLFCHNFGNRNATKLIKESKDLDFSLVSNENSSKKFSSAVGI